LRSRRAKVVKKQVSEGVGVGSEETETKIEISGVSSKTGCEDCGRKGSVRKRKMRNREETS